MTQILLTIFGAVLALLSSLILYYIKKSEDKAEKREQTRLKKEEQREKERQEREELTLQSMDALFCVTKELVECTLHGKAPNGELQEAYNYKQQAKHRLEEYERKQAVKS